MRFIDEVSITIQAGKGGNGAASFRREKYVPFGGPDGGDGGNGGNVYALSCEGINTLVHFRGKKFYQAEDGEAGSGANKNGKGGQDVVLRVPVGTLIKNAETGEILADLTTNNEKVLLSSGGRGGLGNTNFKSSTNQAPTYAQEGKFVEPINLHLELKLLANVALIGLPNAGKSTLISTISAARPKIADYPFTTLTPNLGVVAMGEKSLVVADIPGLIEGAAIGKGLGIKFLKHIERTSLLVHLVDCSWCLDEFEAYESYTTVREELMKFNQDFASKREIICLTKIDAMTEEEIEKFQNFFEDQLDKSVLPLSAVSHRNVDKLTRLMFEALETIQRRDVHE